MNNNSNNKVPVKIENKNYFLDVGRAKELGLLKEEIFYSIGQFFSYTAADGSNIKTILASVSNRQVALIIISASTSCLAKVGVRWADASDVKDFTKITEDEFNVLTNNRNFRLCDPPTLVFSNNNG